MTNFAGYDMPLVYTSGLDEHLHTRKAVGVFDVSHMGQFIIKGKDAAELVQNVTSNSVKKLKIGQAQYSCIPNEDGGIVDDLIVYRLTEDMCSQGEQAFMLVVNASNEEKDWEWISKRNTYDVRMMNISSQTALIAVQGPRVNEVLQALTDVNLDAIEYYHFEKGTLAGCTNVLISATGYTGSGGFELYVKNEDALTIWNSILEHELALPIGLGARDSLRLEMGYCLYGNDITDDTSPIEAGLGWITKTKAGVFPSQDLFAKQKQEGTDIRLVGFTVEGRRVPRNGYELMDANDTVIGRVTSGCHSPTLDKPIGLGYVSLEYKDVGSEFFVAIRKKRLKATVHKLPFVDPTV